MTGAYGTRSVTGARSPSLGAHSLTSVSERWTIESRAAKTRLITSPATAPARTLVRSIGRGLPDRDGWWAQMMREPRGALPAWKLACARGQGQAGPPGTGAGDEGRRTSHFRAVGAGARCERPEAGERWLPYGL